MAVLPIGSINVSFDIGTPDNQKSLIISRFGEAVVGNTDVPLSKIGRSSKNGAITGPKDVFG